MIREAEQADQLGLPEEIGEPIHYSANERNDYQILICELCPFFLLPFQFLRRRGGGKVKAITKILTDDIQSKAGLAVLS